MYLVELPQTDSFPGGGNVALNISEYQLIMIKVLLQTNPGSLVKFQGLLQVNLKPTVDLRIK